MGGTTALLCNIVWLYSLGIFAWDAVKDIHSTKQGTSSQILAILLLETRHLNSSLTEGWLSDLPPTLSRANEPLEGGTICAPAWSWFGQYCTV